MMGEISVKIQIAVAAFILIGIASHYHLKGSFCLALLFGSTIYWTYSDTWPTEIMKVPQIELITPCYNCSKKLGIIIFDLIFLYILYLNGLIFSLSNMAKLTREDGII
jgi:hypothetical protein